MRCYICDAKLRDSEIQVDPNTGTIQPCSPCRQSSNETLSGLQEGNSSCEVGDEYSDDEGYVGVYKDNYI